MSNIQTYTSSSNNSIEVMTKNPNVGKIHQIKNPFANISKLNFEKRKSCAIGNRNQKLFKRYYTSVNKKNKKKQSSDNVGIQKYQNDIKCSKFKRISLVRNYCITSNHINKKLSKERKIGLFIKIKKFFCCMSDVRDWFINDWIIGKL